MFVEGSLRFRATIMYRSKNVVSIGRRGVGFDQVKGIAFVSPNIQPQDVRGTT